MADRFCLPLDEFARAIANSEEYQRANPLGGPAAMFDTIADRIRAGEPMADVLADYGLVFQREPTA